MFGYLADCKRFIRLGYRLLRVFVFAVCNTILSCVFNASLQATCNFSTFYHCHALVDHPRSFDMAVAIFVIIQCRFLHHCAPSDKSVTHASFSTDIAEHFAIFPLQPHEFLLPLNPVLFLDLLAATCLPHNIRCRWLINVISITCSSSTASIPLFSPRLSTPSQ